jgi:hypothetical protein
MVFLQIGKLRMTFVDTVFFNFKRNEKFTAFGKKLFLVNYPQQLSARSTRQITK